VIDARYRAIGLLKNRCRRSGAAQRDALVDEDVVVHRERPGRQLHDLTDRTRIDGSLDP
jgi:hypothetical protein